MSALFRRGSSSFSQASGLLARPSLLVRPSLVRQGSLAGLTLITTAGRSVECNSDGVSRAPSGHSELDLLEGRRGYGGCTDGRFGNFNAKVALGCTGWVRDVGGEADLHGRVGVAPVKERRKYREI